ALLQLVGLLGDVGDVAAGVRQRALLDARLDVGHPRPRDAVALEVAALDQLGVDPQPAAGPAPEHGDPVAVEADAVGRGAVPVDGGDRAADDDQEEHGEQHDPPGDAPALAVAGRAVLVVVEVVVAVVGDDRLELGGVGAAPGPAAGVGLRRVGGAGPGLGAP